MPAIIEPAVPTLDLFLTGFDGAPERSDDPTESGQAALPMIALGPESDRNEEAAVRWKKAVEYLEGLPKDAHGESISDQAYWPFRDDDSFLSGDYCGDVDLDAVLNAGNSPVFAAWFTGVLRMPQGKMLRYVHGGFGSLLERDVVLSTESGVVARRWVLNYIPAFFAKEPDAARDTYSLISMKPRLRPNAAERTRRYLANPFADDFADAVSAIFLDEMSSLWVELFMVSDLVKVAIRTALVEELADAEALSGRDRAARCQYDKTIEAFGNILPGERASKLEAYQ
jgi:hypothetical protein